MGVRGVPAKGTSRWAENGLKDVGLHGTRVYVGPCNRETQRVLGGRVQRKEGRREEETFEEKKIVGPTDYKELKGRDTRRRRE